MTLAQLETQPASRLSDRLASGRPWARARRGWTKSSGVSVALSVVFVDYLPVTVRPWIASVLIASTLLACAAFAADFQSATIVDASTQNELLSNGTGGVVPVPHSTVTVLIAGLKITAQYYTADPSGPRAASQLVVGDMVQARVDGKWLYFVVPSGKTIKARIVRQERVEPK